MKPISTRTHGVLDLISAGTLIALPRVLGWGEGVTRTLTNMGVGTLAYSLLTRYEFGLVKVLPMRAHLALDFASGAALCASPLLFPDEDPGVTSTLVGIGLFEIAAASLTRTQTGVETRGVDRLLESARTVPTSSGFREGLGRSSTSSSL